jgi:tetratricopeptide (TPR) repeat protein
MKTIKNLFFCLILFLQVISLGADEAVLTYLDGYIEIKLGSTWYEAEIGDNLPLDSYIRVMDNGMAEISTDSAKIIVNKEGTYSIKELLASNEDLSSIDYGSVLEFTLTKLFGDSDIDYSDSTTAGVRGDEQDNQDLFWMEAEEDYLGNGMTMISEGKLDEAYANFEEAILMAFTETEIQTYQFYLAYIESLRGNIASALKNISSLDISKTNSIYPDYVILKGKLFISSLMYNEALNLFENYLLSTPINNDSTQTVYILQSLCYKGLDNLDAAIISLQNAHNLNPASELGLSSERMLETMK